MTKRVEVKIEDDALPDLLTALGQLKGIDALKVEPVRVRVRTKSLLITGSGGAGSGQKE